MEKLNLFNDWLKKQMVPPRPGLIFDKQKHRWIRPETGEMVEPKELFRELITQKFEAQNELGRLSASGAPQKEIDEQLRRMNELERKIKSITPSPKKEVSLIETEESQNLKFQRKELEFQLEEQGEKLEALEERGNTEAIKRQKARIKEIEEKLKKIAPQYEK